MEENPTQIEIILIRIQNFLINAGKAIAKNWLLIGGALAAILPVLEYFGQIGIIEDWPKMSVLIIGTLNVFAGLFGLEPIPVPNRKPPVNGTQVNTISKKINKSK